MERLTKTYKDGTHGAADDLPMGENSYAYKNALIEKLGSLEDLEEQGKVLKLPCEVGDKIYEPRPDRGMVTEYIVNYIGYYGKDYDFFIGWRLNSGIYSNLSGVHASKIGKTVFLTREEAEAALKEM